MENQIESEREEQQLKKNENDSHDGSGKKKCPQVLNLFNLAMQQQQEQRRQSLANDPKGPLTSGIQFESNQQTLMLEYKMLQKYAPIGMYVLPQVDKKTVWHGVYFVKQGIYSGGIFRFKIEFPPLYPKWRPNVSFTVEFKEWTPGKHWMINILMYIKKLFHLEQMFNLQDTDVLPSNKDAFNNFNHNFKEFVEKSKECVQRSQDNKFKNPAMSMLQFSQYLPVHDQIVEQIKLQAKEQDETQDQQAGKEALKNWFFHNLKELTPNHSFN
eukprot:403357569